MPRTSAESCEAELEVDETAGSDWVDEVMTDGTENLRTLDYSGGLRGSCCSARFVAGVGVR
jgi:hypothetical protein